MRENQCDLRQKVCCQLRGGFRWSLFLPRGFFLCFCAFKFRVCFLPWRRCLVWVSIVLSANKKVDVLVGVACAELFVLVFCSLLCVRRVLSNSRGPLLSWSSVAGMGSILVPLLCVVVRTMLAAGCGCSLSLVWIMATVCILTVVGMCLY